MFHLTHPITGYISERVWRGLDRRTRRTLRGYKRDVVGRQVANVVRDLRSWGLVEEARVLVRAIRAYNREILDELEANGLPTTDKPLDYWLREYC